MTGALVTVYDTGGNVPSLPPGVEYALAYDDGSPVGEEILRRFPNCKLITITTVPDNFNFEARICDSEASGFSSEQAAWWANEKVKRKERPCIYVEVSLKEDVAQKLAAYGLEFGRDVDCWLAWWNDDPVIPEGIVDTPWGPVGTGTGNIAIQYHRDNPFTWDVSVALADWVTPPPPPPPQPTEVEMFDAIRIVPEPPTYPQASVFLNGGTVWIGPVDAATVKELEDNKATIFQSKTNSVFHAKAAVPYPEQ